MIALRISRLERLDDVGVDIDDESKQKTCDRRRWIEFDVMRKANNHKFTILAWAEWGRTFCKFCSFALQRAYLLGESPKASSRTCTHAALIDFPPSSNWQEKELSLLLACCVHIACSLLIYHRSSSATTVCSFSDFDKFVTGWNTFRCRGGREWKLIWLISDFSDIALGTRFTGGKRTIEIKTLSAARIPQTNIF